MTQQLLKTANLKLTISETDRIGATLWEGEALSATWDSSKVEFLIRGDTGSREFSRVMNSIAEKHRLVVGIEDRGLTQVVWRGQIGTARFKTHDPGHIELSLVMSLDDWFGIFPGFSSFYFG
ncbi:MAG: hypothetical protein IBX68_10140 [Dehalococcoidia bacterium]|nr:hypothetical protein [Dehalococcoidia bacterium]